MKLKTLLLEIEAEKMFNSEELLNEGMFGSIKGMESRYTAAKNAVSAYNSLTSENEVTKPILSALILPFSRIIDEFAGAFGEKVLHAYNLPKNEIVAKLKSGEGASALKNFKNEGEKVHEDVETAYKIVGHNLAIVYKGLCEKMVAEMEQLKSNELFAHLTSIFKDAIKKAPMSKDEKAASANEPSEKSKY